MKKNFNATSSYTIYQLSAWLDSLILQNIPADFIPKVKKWARVPEVNQLKPEVYPEHNGIFFTFQNQTPVIKNLSELSSELSIEKHHIPTQIKTLDATQKIAQLYLQKIATRLYQANPEILGEQPSISFEPQYHQKKEKGMMFLVKYWPPRIQFNIYELVHRYTSEDLLAWDVAHELIHLTLARQFVNRTNSPQEESICDILGSLCMARAGYKPSESVLEWADFIQKNQKPIDRSILEEKENPHLSFENRYHIYDAFQRGLMDLPVKTGIQLHQTFRLMPPPDTHPKSVIRMLYTNAVNNYLIDNNIIKKEQATRKAIPIDSLVYRKVTEKMGLRLPIYTSKMSPTLKAKLLKRFKKRQKQNQ